MFNGLLRLLVTLLLRLRYRVDVSGLEAIAAKGTRGILFLPSHPALIDPFIVMSTLARRFSPQVIADSEAIDLPGVRELARRFGAVPIPNMAKQGPEARQRIEEVLTRCAGGLQIGENWLLYPAGHILLRRVEELGANSAVETLLREAPATRIVLLRTRGLWGSGFSRALDGRPPAVGKLLLKGIGYILLNGIFFSPRRRVTLEFVEPDDLPRSADRRAFNQYLEQFYNKEPLPRNTYVPYTVWERGGTVERSEPPEHRIAGDVETVSPATRSIVIAHLLEFSGKAEVRDEDHLANDLGMDSLARAELMVWLEQEFGFPQGYADSMQTVADVLLAASGEAMSNWVRELDPAPASWFEGANCRGRLVTAEGETITAAFLRQAARRPDTVIIADQTSGVKTYRDLITGIFALLPQIKALPGERLGIMLPASVAATTVYLATLFAGKTPVMVNWTVGPRNMQHALKLADVLCVVTAQRLLSKLESQGVDLQGMRKSLLCLETIAQRIPREAKLLAWLQSHLSWTSLRRAPVSATAAILFTSGSENLPKAVPLTHANLLTNIRDVLQAIEVREDDRLLGMLPPFHSFGLTVNMLLALCAGLRTVYHVNPTEGAMLARITEGYHVTMLIGTPTFLHGIVRAATPAQLTSLRLAVTGAEECPPRVYAALREQSPHAAILEGYGITECSPIVSVNTIEDPRPYTIGRLLPSLEALLVNVETGEPVQDGETGMLLLRGPSIFAGYLGKDVPRPFVEVEGQSWYRTGDLVSRDADGVFTFRGRLKRFVKIGGEMISLPAIESALQEQISSDAADGPQIAVVATANDERPELALFTTETLDREVVNRRIRAAGLSPLHNIRRVVAVEAIPVLGTGKIDYRTLQQWLEQEVIQPSRS